MSTDRPPSLATGVLRTVMPPVVLALALIVVVGVLVDRQATASAREQALALQHTRALDLAVAGFESLKHDARAVARIDLVRNGLIDTQERYRYLPALFRSLRLGHWDDAEVRLELLDFLGRPVISNDATGGPQLSEVGSAAALEVGEEVFSLDARGLFFATPVTIHDQIEGSVAVSAGPDHATALLADWETLGAEVALADADGQVLHANERWSAARGYVLPSEPELRPAASIGLERAGLPALTLWSLLPREHELPGVSQRFAIPILVVVLSLGVIVTAVVLAATLTARSVERFVGDLQRLMRDPASSGRVAEQGPRELQQLASAFNETLTALEASERERRAREQAEAANRAKSAFLANMSHEIRTPLNAVMGFAQILERDPTLGQAQREQVRTISRSGSHLLQLINDVLDLSRIEAGRVGLHEGPFGLRTVLNDVAEMFRARAEAKAIGFTMEVEAGVPTNAFGDEAKLRQVLVNLVGNAVKFTHRGEVMVKARRARAEGGPGGDERVGAATVPPGDRLDLIVEVQDSGPGIEAADLERLFASFYQGDAGRAEGGTGLGLTITKGLIDLMGGTIEVESSAGSGAAFRFEVPLGEASDEEFATSFGSRLTVAGLEPGSASARVLVVDDKPSNRGVLRLALERVGFEVREAVDGAEALAVFDAWAPDLVLMDMRMPVMDGFEATRRIKMSARGRETPVVAVTASAFDDDEVKILSSGADAFVRKPFQWEELFETIARVIPVEYRYTEVEPDPPGRPHAEVGSGAVSHEVREALRSLAALLARDDTAALEHYRERRAVLRDAFESEAEALERQLASFAFGDALVTVRRMLAQV